MEVSEYLVGSPAFKAGGTGDPRTAGSIPVHLRHSPSVGGLGALAFWVVVITMWATPAGAAVRLLDSSPVDGASIVSVEDIRFEFDGLLISDAAASVTVTRTNGQSIPVVDVAVDGTILRARVVAEVPPGTYEIGYVVRSADGDVNEGALRVSIDTASQELSGGLLAVIGIFSAIIAVLFLVFLADKRRRPSRQRRGPATG